MAVLGIVAVNVAGFAGPPAGTNTPNLPHPGTFADEAAYAAIFLLFEGKMRAIFSMLFGASMCLFVERADAAGRWGEGLQLRRLGWLMLFGWLHYVLLWWGDILFLYGACGVFALVLRRLPLRWLLGLAGGIFALWHGAGMLAGWPVVMAEEHVRLGTASIAQAGDVARQMASLHTDMAQDIAQAHMGFVAMAADKLAHAPLWPLALTLDTAGETLPLMLLGVALYRSGFFAGNWPARRLWAMLATGLALGLPMTAAMAAWAWARHFPPLAMPQILAFYAAPAHVLMALAYMAGLMLAAPWLAGTWAGRRLIAAGRVAFSNYLGTSLVLAALFYGWGLGLFGQLGHAGQLPFIAAVWAAMLAWSAPWLSHFRQGPLEWLWRSATEGRAMPMRRAR